jgi:hypothetical protein
MGEAKRRRELDPNFGKSATPLKPHISQCEVKKLLQELGEEILRENATSLLLVQDSDEKTQPHDIDQEILKYRAIGRKLFPLSVLKEFAYVMDCEMVTPLEEITEEYSGLPYEMRCALSWDDSVFFINKVRKTEGLTLVETLKPFCIEATYHIPTCD